MNEIDRLTELLDQKDSQIEALEEELRKAKNEIEQAEDGWRALVSLPTEQTLPVPRLELVLTRQSEFVCVWHYRLVYRHFAEGVLAVPLGRTTIQGGRADRIYPADHPNGFGGKLVLPHRDGAHICADMAHLQLPGFAVFGNHVDNLSSIAGKPHERW